MNIIGEIRDLIEVSHQTLITNPYGAFRRALRDREKTIEIGLAIDYLIRTIKILELDPSAFFNLGRLEFQDFKKIFEICLYSELTDVTAYLIPPSSSELEEGLELFIPDIPDEIKARILITYLLCLRLYNVMLLSQETLHDKCPHCFHPTEKSTWIIESWVCSICEAEIPLTPGGSPVLRSKASPEHKQGEQDENKTCPKCGQKRIIQLIQRIKVLCQGCQRPYGIGIEDNSPLLELIQNISHPPAGLPPPGIENSQDIEKLFRGIILAGYGQLY